MKVICESCGTIFKAKAVSGMSCCPVCGASFDDSEEEIDLEVNLSEDEEGLMYFDEILIFKDAPQYSGVSLYCGKCGEDSALEIDKFDKLVDEKYVILKKDVILTCKGCGKEHKPRKILYKLKDHYAPPLPHCPVCNSLMLKRISAGSKFLAAATLGAFAIPYNSKTYECKNCGHRF